MNPNYPIFPTALMIYLSLLAIVHISESGLHQDQSCSRNIPGTIGAVPNSAFQVLRNDETDSVPSSLLEIPLYLIWRIWVVLRGLYANGLAAHLSLPPQASLSAGPVGKLAVSRIHLFDHQISCTDIWDKTRYDTCIHKSNVITFLIYSQCTSLFRIPSREVHYYHFSITNTPVEPIPGTTTGGSGLIH